MNKAGIQQREDTILHLLTHAEKKGIQMNYRQASKVIDAIHKDIATLERLNYEFACYQMSDKETERKERQEAAAENRIKEIGKKYQFGVMTGGDPRGYAIKLFFVHKPHNSFGGKEHGWGFYWGKKY